MGDLNDGKTLKAKTFAFSIRCVRLAETLQDDNHGEINPVIKKKEFVMSKQFLRSGTAVGAMIREAEQAHSKPDFIAKLTIALKEASEAEYWLDLLFATEYIHNRLYTSLQADIKEIIKMLTASVKTGRSNM